MFPFWQAPKPALDTILNDPKLDGAVVAAVVADLDGHVLFERNIGAHVVPASNMKLLSNAFALHQLGPDWRPRTRFWKQPEGVYVDSAGDPLLRYEQLVGVRSRLGADRKLPVYLHQTYAPLWRDNWEYGDLPNKFAAPVCAFTVDRGSFEIWAKGGRPQLRPEAYGTKVVESDLPGAQTVYDPFSRRILAGKGAFAKDGLVDTLSLPRPDEAAAGILGCRMISSDKMPAREPDLVIAGATCADIVKECLPPSDNQLAEQLLMLGAQTEGPLGDDAYALARRRLANFLTRIVGINPDDVHVDDGSGLSRHNYLTARAIIQLLAWANRQPTRDVWRSALARSASSSGPGTGTLAQRLSGLTFLGKTGSLEMVASLSGYLETVGHQTRIVSVILNEFACSASEARAVADRFVRAVAASE